MKRLLFDYLWRLRRNWFLIPLSKLPAHLGVTLFLGTHWAIPGYDRISLRQYSMGYRVTNITTGEVYHFPGRPGVVLLRNVSTGYRDMLRRKYSLDGFVEVEVNDIVVDIGAFVGGFALSAAERAALVIAFEPSSHTFVSLTKNPTGFGNILCYRRIISDERGEYTLNLARDPTDNSVLNVDGHSLGQTETVESLSLNDSDLIPGTVDFVKIDAEGAEPEVIKGMDGLVVRKIAIDCGAERYGETTVERVSAQLEQRGYEVRRRDSIVFARESQSTGEGGLSPRTEK